jgi:GT2 family glycosyltransferase
VKRVAVVILNWNGEKFLKQFLPGVVQHSQDMADVVVIDNASKDSSVTFLRNQFPDVRVIELSKNYGFAGGYNHGLKDISHEYFVLLNSDVEVTEGWIKPVIDFMESQPGMVACQPKMLDFHRKEWFEYAGAAGGFIDKDAYAFCAGRIFYEFEKDDQQYSQNEEVFWASGAALFIRRDAWNEVGGLDQDFFAHMEEIDLCWRLKNRGYKIGACRQSIVYHYGGGTLDRLSPFKTYLNFRNNLYMIVKNYRAGNLTWHLLRRMSLDGIAAIRFITSSLCLKHITASIAG